MFPPSYTPTPFFLALQPADYISCLLPPPSSLWLSSLVPCSGRPAGARSWAAFPSSMPAPHKGLLWRRGEASSFQGGLPWRREAGRRVPGAAARPSWGSVACTSQPQGRRLGLGPSSSFPHISPATVIKGISLLKSQLGTVVLHFLQFSLMTKL